MPIRPFLIIALLLGGLVSRVLAMPPGDSGGAGSDASRSNSLRQLQAEAIRTGQADWGHWGVQPSNYAQWGQHSNRLIPVYTFGIDLASVRGEHSVYRDPKRIEQLYGYSPAGTLNPEADYFDQTDIYRLQQSAADAGKRRIILFIFDGLDWPTTRAAAVYRAGEVRYQEGRGSGLHYQDYRGAATDFGYMVTSPFCDGGRVDVNSQTVDTSAARRRGGYDPKLGGDAPWSTPADPAYLISQSHAQPHAFTDSAASATSMCSGIKTYNDAINVDPQGHQVETMAQKLQRQGWAVGAVTSVPLSHATPACAYANNVFRDDYQDIARDMVGLPSVSHRTTPLPGMDVVIGTGWGDNVTTDRSQGDNFVPGNRYITAADLQAIDVDHGGRYQVVQRTSGINGGQALGHAAAEAAENHHRLLGMFGAGLTNHLPFRTADGRYDPAPGRMKIAEQYSPEDLNENPHLSDIALAALTVLSQNPNGFWLMIEAGDVDWANHDDNIDSSVGAIFDGDDAFQAVTDWIEHHGGWQDTVLVVTADHGHYFNLTKPEVFAEAGKQLKSAPPSKASD
jgi:alkaline phosphatase